jgi:hypothetical protein
VINAITKKRDHENRHDVVGVTVPSATTVDSTTVSASTTAVATAATSAAIATTSTGPSESIIRTEGDDSQDEQQHAQTESDDSKMTGNPPRRFLIHAAYGSPERQLSSRMGLNC